MIATTISGVNCWLLPYEPNDGAEIKVDIAVPVDEHRGLTGRSTRRPTAILPRYELSWSSFLEQTDYATLRAASLASQDEPILVPLWPHLFVPGAESPTMTGGLMIAFKWDWSAWAINPGSYAGYDAVAPLLYGRFKQPPRLASQSGTLVVAQFDFEEDGPAAYAVTPVTGILAADTLGTSGGNQFPNFPFLPDWSDTPPQPGIGVYDVERTATGPGRMKATVFYPQTPEQVITADFTGLSKIESAQFIAWWIRRGGASGAHFVSLESFGITSGGTILARHTNETLSISYAGIQAQAEFSWREVAAEYAPPSGETLGTTLGALPAPAWFFQLDLDYNGAIKSWYLTDWESGAVANGQTWAYNACDFDKLTQSIDLEDDSCSVNFRYFAGGPWDNWLPGNLAARGFVTIFRAEANLNGSFSNFRQVWKGELSTPEIDGPMVKQTALGANALFARNCPRQVMSTSCGTMLYRPRCGLALSDWTFNAVITAVAGNIVTVGTITRANGGALPGGFGATDWFALGFMGWPVDGLPMREGILSSTEISAGVIILTLDRACTLGVGAAVTVVPGCDRIKSSGCAKFSNGDNYRGFAQMPAISPNFVIPQQNANSAKK
jgi:hypothetical protein